MIPGRKRGNGEGIVIFLKCKLNLAGILFSLLLIHPCKTETTWPGDLPLPQNADLKESMQKKFWRTSSTLTGAPGPFYGHLDQDHEENWWAQVNFPDLKEEDYDEVRDMIYNNIKTLNFRFAMADIEVDIFRTYSELQEDLDRMHFDHLVLSQETWREFGIPNGFYSIGDNKMRSRTQNYV